MLDKIITLFILALAAVPELLVAVPTRLRVRVRVQVGVPLRLALGVAVRVPVAVVRRCLFPVGHFPFVVCCTKAGAAFGYPLPRLPESSSSR